jgi:hypothetical protein
MKSSGANDLKISARIDASPMVMVGLANTG